MITLNDVKAAAEKISSHVRRTPLWKSETLSKRLGTNVYLKMELFQKTGSFKPRGAFNQMLAREKDVLDKGAVAISGGNFAQGVAYASSVLGVDIIVCMAEDTPKNYVDATRGYSATIDFSPDIQAAFNRYNELAEQGRTALHPFDNHYQMSGAGNVALEIFEDLPEITDLVISIGGGGLISGNTVAIKGLKPQVRVWGVETEGAATMKSAMDAGKVVNIKPTSMSRTLGSPFVAQDALTIAQEHLEGLLIVTDKQAIDAQQLILERTKVLPELAASCTLAAAEKIKDRFGPDEHLVLLMCGGNESVANLVNYAKIT
ncbi:pyridoxal-phosphate dependent enzyme [Deltaproteobacteria bacterium]|nr:pyridoxal-phosphate dependent enzyme [Deltaproteobacteria bacterium]